MAVIDLSIVVVPWNTRKLVLECVERNDPGPTRIEYHRLLYRFFRKYRERSRMAIVSVLHIAKSLFRVMSQPPLTVRGERQRVRRVVNNDVWEEALR